MKPPCHEQLPKGLKGMKHLAFEERKSNQIPISCLSGSFAAVGLT
jgi:hypothetical protein